MLAVQVSSPAQGEVECTWMRCSVVPGVATGVGIVARISLGLWISGWRSALMVWGRG